MDRRSGWYKKMVVILSDTLVFCGLSFEKEIFQACDLGELVGAGMRFATGIMKRLSFLFVVAK